MCFRRIHRPWDAQLQLAHTRPPDLFRTSSAEAVDRSSAAAQSHDQGVVKLRFPGHDTHAEAALIAAHTRAIFVVVVVILYWINIQRGISHRLMAFLRDAPSAQGTFV